MAVPQVGFERGATLVAPDLRKHELARTYLIPGEQQFSLHAWRECA